MQTTLDIYVDGECPGCDQARRLARVIQQKLPEVIVNLVDLTQKGVQCPQFVFAVPTYVLNGETISLGNPDEVSLMNQLRAELDLRVH